MTTATATKPQNGTATATETTVDTRNLWQRLRDAQAAARGISKNGTAPAQMGGFKFIQDSDVADAARDLLSGNGIVYVPSMVEQSTEQAGTTSNGKAIWRTRAHVRIRLRNADKPDEFEDFEWFGFGDDTADKGLGKAGTSTVKNALMKLLLLQGDPKSDPDASDATDGEGRAPQHRPAPRPETPADHAREAGKAASGGAEANRVPMHHDDGPAEGQLFGPCPQCGDGRVKAEWVAKKNKMIAVCSLRDWRDKSSCQWVEWAPDWLRIEAAVPTSEDGQPPIDAYDESEIPL